MTSPRQFGGAFWDAIARIRPVDGAAALAAGAHHDRLTKPRGSLGRLEATGIQLAAISGETLPPIPEPAVVAVFAGDHGVIAEGVTPWPQEVTAQMVSNFVGGGAAINVFARQVGATVVVVDVGVASDLDPAEGLLIRKVRTGTRNLRVEPAMRAEEVLDALDAGATVAAELVAGGARCLITGDMGIANTTPSAALICALTGRSPEEITGRGTGIDDTTWARKVEVIKDALARTAASSAAASRTDAAESTGEPLNTLASLGGLEIAALVGFIAGGAAHRIPVLVDGVIATAALLVASGCSPLITGYCFSGHRSVEPGSAAVLRHLGMEPLLDLDLRLGEGTGACLALPLLQASARVLREMATFDSAGVTDKTP